MTSKVWFKCQGFISAAKVEKGSSPIIYFFVFFFIFLSRSIATVVLTSKKRIVDKEKNLRTSTMLDDVTATLTSDRGRVIRCIY